MQTHGQHFEILTYAGAPGGTVERDLTLTQVVHQMQMGGARGTGRRPTRVYSQVAAVYACVAEKAKAMSIIPMVISTADDRILESGPAVDLAECPNPNMSSRQFWKTVSAHLDLFGRAHLWLELAPGGFPVAVVPINPLQMKAIIDRSTGKLSGWRYRAAGKLRGQEAFIPADEVHSIIDTDFEDPDRPFDGLSPRRAAATAIAQYWKADIANETSLDNDMQPSGYFKTEQNLGEEQRSSLLDYAHDVHAGVFKRRRQMVLTGGLEWVPNAPNFSDMEFTTLKSMSRTDICAAYGVPPSVAGFYEDSNYAHAEAAEKAFWTRTILPRAAWFAEEWRVGVLSRFRGDRSLAASDATQRAANIRERCCHGFRIARKATRRSRDRLFAWFDSSDVPAVQAAKLSQAEAGKTWIDKGVPLNEVIRAYDLPFTEQPHGDTWYKPIGLIDVNDDSPFPGFDDPAGDEPIDGEAGAGRERSIDTTKAPNEATRARIWAMWRASWGSLERAAAKRLKRHFFELRTETLDRLHKTMPKTSAKGLTPDERRDTIASILFNIVEANGKLQVKVGPLIRDAYRLGGEQAMQEAADASGGEPDPFSIAEPNVAERMRRRQIKLNGANRSTQRELAKTLAEGLEAAEGIAKLEERVKHVFKKAAGPRARRIARTEVSAAVEESRHEGKRQAGVPLKSWLHSRKETGRPSHAATERATMSSPIPVDQDYEITGTGVTCPHPKATGQPGHDINCGCTSLSRYPNDNLKTVLDRYVRRGFLTYERMIARDAARDNGGKQ